MKVNYKGLAENSIFALLTFIVFFMIFEDKVVVPVWLQALGRLHPMLLHFPIVILMLSMFLEFFRLKSNYRSQEIYQIFTTNLLLSGILFSGVTIILGMFLSKEEGYSGDILQWHKWTGISIVFFAAIIYWLRNTTWYSDPLAKAGAALTVLSICCAGHFGAVLTHGENFILAPLMTSEEVKVPLEQAVVFDHVVLPIFKQKCASCHNPNKMKGELILTDSSFIKKGGEAGPLYVAGNPETSLLMERLYLPLSDKKHMPPSGKEQLTYDEILMISQWIKGKASFTDRVIALPAGDSLRILATALLEPDNGIEEEFKFESADDKTIQKLNNDYRDVSPIAVQSPALAVNIYNKEVYTGNTLEELLEVKSQIIFLNLNGMPVEDMDLETIGEFVNLRTLHLNFTNITGQGLKALSSLNHLKSLSLSGTNLNYNDLLLHMPLFKGVSKVTLWSTGLSDTEIQKLQAANPHIDFIAGFNDAGMYDGDSSGNRPF